MAQSHDRGLDRPMTRRAFVRGSAVSIGALAAGSALTSSRPARAAAPGAADALPPYVGAGSNAPVRPFPLYQVALGDGLFKEKRERILNFARAYDQRRYLVLFNDVAGRPNPPGVSVPGGWEDGGLLSGHWTGHFMSMLAQAHVSTGERIFTDKLSWMVDELGACQDALAGATVHPGYLGAKPEDVVLRQGPPRFAVYGGNQSTNTWAPWYVQHKIMRGFLDTYYLTGDARAFDIVEKMASWAHLALTLGDVNHPNYTGPITRDDLNFMWDTYIAGEFGGANEVFPEIFALTGDARHLQTAKAFDNRESLFDACVQNRDILVCAPGTQPGRRRPPRLHANTHVPNFTGYLRIYEQTGEADYFQAARNFRGMIVPHRMFAHGGTSGNYPGSNNNVEQLQNRDNIANAIANDGAETCTTYNLLKLTRNLFFHEQDPAYMDYYERGLFNQIAGSRADNDRTSNPQVTYFQPLTPGRGRSYGNTGTCCGGTGLENHTKYQESIYFHSADDSTLWVNLFVSSTLDWQEKGFTITQETDF
ncbi:MAG TPA: beta-L-arabinofuranosidase domain-containing protein, partial [Kofleriaceae bacterium]|nr:beta-L-arabinofuranosidase domain-containing protein [Kofleriaceae bacterium]